MIEPQIFEGTAREVRTLLEAIPDAARVRVIVGRPSLTVMARRLQATAAANGITDAVHDALMQSLTHDR